MIAIHESIERYPLTIGHTGQYSGVSEVVSLLPHGPKITVWRWEMPRIDDQILDCVIYLYPSAAHADRSEAAGGTGFLVAVPSEQHPNVIYVHAVTNSHVIREGKSPVIRFNTQQGARAIGQLNDAQWVHHPDGDDIAIAVLGGLDQALLKFRCIPTSMFVTPELIAQNDIGPGDDVFMVGRFVSHEGRQRNLPSLRFGNISMMPWEKVRHGRQYDVESFLVETRSLSGYSGSPVFVHISPATSRPGDQGAVVLGRATGPRLLGIDWGHVNLYEKVKERDRQTDSPEGYVVESNSGQMAVSPAWKLNELLNLDQFVQARRQEDERIAAIKAQNGIVMDTAIDALKGGPSD